MNLGSGTTLAVGLVLYSHQGHDGTAVSPVHRLVAAEVACGGGTATSCACAVNAYCYVAISITVGSIFNEEYGI